MIKWADLFTLNYNDILDEKLIKWIASKSYSRLPVLDST